ncbi:hypothetical protein PybrP1_003700 [[Pythium] brassicae (nom. inval.)]|nr:hypothetical protein PybrP1_003700 [[Pythium] brassicae (nom. inval.)]
MRTSAGCTWLLVLAAVAARSALGATNTTATPDFYCKTDADCAKYPNTVCITIEAKDPISKCTPNTAKRPACRKGQYGLCPSYQDTERGYLNAHCIFVADDSVAPSSVTGGGGGAAAATTNSTLRWLQAATVKPAETNSTTVTATRAPLTVAPPATVATTDGNSTGGGVTVGDSSGDGGQATAVASASYKIGNQTVYGIFKCADLSECDALAADSTTCRPAKCGDANSVNQCNNQGTCTHTSKLDIKQRSCMCYKGFSGTKCEKTDSGQCDVDCGLGGDCVDGLCVCKAGYDGKKYKNKQGKSDSRCTRCTNDQACANNNPCDIETGKCACEAGYTGTTCGGVEDLCVEKSCGIGSCNIVSGKAVCQCPICSPECQTCPTKDCSTCPSAASSVTLSLGALVVCALASLLMG